MRMKIHNILLALSIALSILLFSCRARGGKVAVDETPAESAVVQRSGVARVFIPSLPPALLTDEQKRQYTLDHYWDKFDFSDTTFIAEVDFRHMLRAYAIYVGESLPDSLSRPVMSRLMQKASASKSMFEYFLKMAEIVLHDPNSQVRSDEKYIPVLESVIASHYLDEYEKLPYVYDLEMALKNRVGHRAEDFVYTLASGASGRLYDVKADYTLIFVSNPGCPMCREIKEQIASSPIDRKSVV